MLEKEIVNRKQAEDALRETETRFRLALKNAPVSVAVQDHNFVYQWAYTSGPAGPTRSSGKQMLILFRSGGYSCYS